MSLVGEARVGLRMLGAVPRVLRNRITADEVERTIQSQVARRADDFLALARRAIYDVPGSPYQRLLLEVAGCPYADLESLVRGRGLEAALHELYGRGVYLTVDEFKGRAPVVRGAARFRFEPSQFRPPQGKVHMLGQTGGSRGSPTPLQLDLNAVRRHGVTRRMVLEAHGGLGWQHALWGVPGGWAIDMLLQFAGIGATPVRWFTQVNPSASGLAPRYAWSVRGLRWAALTAGVRLPRPEHVPLSDPLPIARWMAEVRRDGGIPHLETFSSPAVRLCEAAREAGIDIAGACISVSSEPATPARRAAMARAGVTVLASYGSAECGPIGVSCLNRAALDDYHLCSDLHAVIPADGQVPGLPAKALLITSLRELPRAVLLNASMGDQADLDQGPCGCPLERFGLTTHVRDVRSFEKLNAGGMTFLDPDIVRALEEVLPSRFGGGSTDYQLVESEDAGGNPKLRLRVHPAVGPIDSDAVISAFLDTIGEGAGVERVYATQWREARMIQVERREPVVTAVGKVHHLHQELHAAPRPSLGAAGGAE